MPPAAYEILYVDNASTDGSADLVGERFPDVRILRLERNFGFAEGNNRGVTETRGRHIAVLNQDTVCHRRWLSELVATPEAHPDVKAVHSNILTPWCPGYPEKRREGWPPIVHISELNRFSFVTYRQRPFSPEPIETLFLAGAASMVEREVVERFGYLFDPDFFAYCEDTDLALRVRNLGYRSLLAPTSVVYHDLQPSTGPSWRTLRKTLMILRNRGLAYKNMEPAEFLAFLPWLLIGAPSSRENSPLARCGALCTAWAPCRWYPSPWAGAPSTLARWGAKERRAATADAPPVRAAAGAAPGRRPWGALVNTLGPGRRRMVMEQ